MKEFFKLLLVHILNWFLLLGVLVAGLYVLFYLINSTAHSLYPLNGLDLPTRIDNHADYSSLIKKLDNGKAGDVITLKIAGVGGDMFAGVQIFNAIKNSNAHVIVHVKGNAYSMHALFVCAADEYRIDDNLHLMYHTYQLNYAPPPERRVAFDNQMVGLFKVCYDAGILNVPTIQALMADSTKEHYINSKQLSILKERHHEAHQGT